MFKYKQGRTVARHNCAISAILFTVYTQNTDLDFVEDNWTTRRQTNWPTVQHADKQRAEIHIWTYRHKDVHLLPSPRMVENHCLRQISFSR